MALVRTQRFYSCLVEVECCKPKEKEIKKSLCEIVTFSSTKATAEENREAIIEDSIAYGILMTTVSVFQFVMGIFCIDLFNYTAMYD